MATTNFFLTYCGQSLIGLCLFMEVRYRISSVVKTLLNILLTVKTEWPKCFQQLKILRYFEKR